MMKKALITGITLNKKANKIYLSNIDAKRD